MLRSVPLACILVAAGCGQGSSGSDMGVGNLSVLDQALPASTVLTAAQTLTTCLAVDATSVYWLDEGAGTRVMKVALAGGTPVVLAQGGRSRGCVAIDAVNAYYLGGVDADGDAGAGDVIMKVPVGGGTATPLAGGQHVEGRLVTEGGHVWWLTDVYGPPDAAFTGKSAIVRVPQAGGAVEVVYAEVTAPAGDLAVDAANLYFSDMNGVFSRARSGGALSAPYGMSTLHRNAFVIDGMNLAMAEVSAIGMGDVAIMKLDGSGRVVVSTQLATPLAVDGLGVYVNQGNRLTRLSLDGKTATELTARSARAVALDATTIYFTDGASILKLSK